MYMCPNNSEFGYTLLLQAFARMMGINGHIRSNGPYFIHLLCDVLRDRSGEFPLSFGMATTFAASPS